MNTDAGEKIRQLQLQDLETISVYNYFITQFRVIVTYIRLLFLPVNQIFEYDFPMSESIFEPATLLSGFFLLIIFVSSIYLWIRSRKTGNGYGLLISFGILWFFITLSIESSIIPIKDIIFEHRLYLPSIGFILSTTAILLNGFAYIENRIGQNISNYVVGVILTVTVVIFSYAAYERNILWSDSYLMWLDNVNKTPNKAGPHNSLGIIYTQKGELEKAIEEFNTALRLNQSHIKARINLTQAHYALGNRYYSEGRFDKARQEYINALKLNPNYAEAHNSLGNIYYNQDMFVEAMQEYLVAARIKQDFSEAHYNLGNVYYYQGRFDEALQEYLTSLRLNSDSAEINVATHYSIGNIYYKQGRFDEAIKEFQITIKLKPDHFAASKMLENARQTTR